MVSGSTLQLSKIEFWCGIREKYPQLSENANKLLLSFPTIYLYEVGFSSYTSTKSICHKEMDYRSRQENPAILY